MPENVVAGCLNASGKAAGSATQQDAESGMLIAHSLRGEGHDASEDGTGRGTPLVFDTTQITCKDNYSSPQPGDPCHPLAAGAHAPAVAFQTSQSGVRCHETHATLDANNGSRRHHGAMTHKGVRRLMPEECETLMGFPRGYTAITYRGKPAADGPRYRALGNSIAVPVLAWIGRRIEAVNRL
jgi:DNA (cytosine-5)-methyltransferase 1